MAQLAIHLLGTFQATVGGAPVVGFESDKVRALLAYLAVEGDRPQRRETLAGILWPDMAERDARTNLRQALANLRKVLGDRESDNPFLLVSRQTIQINRQSDLNLDVQIVTDAITATTAHPHESIDRCDVCITQLQQVVTVYQGAFLEGFSLDSDLFEAWMVVQREKYHIQLLDALDRLAAYHLNKGDYVLAQCYAQQQVELEPWRESAHRQLMQAYAMSGQRGMALAQYETCRRVLRDELGIEPEVETTGLYEEIRSGDFQAETPVTTQAPKPKAGETGTIPHNLPASITPFVGRETLLQEITCMIEDPDCRLLTLLGPGGSGKTRLALESAGRLIVHPSVSHFTDGIFFVPLAAVGKAEGIVPAIAQAIGFSFYGEGEPQAQLLGYLRRKHMLLVLDNYEQLAGDTGMIIDLLRTAQGIQVVVTSRVKLNMPAEQLISIPGMTYPAATTDLNSMLEHSAMKLFVQCARRVQPDFTIGENAGAVVAICQRVQGMPLGIMLATAWLRMLAPVRLWRRSGAVWTSWMWTGRKCRYGSAVCGRYLTTRGAC
ncbi:MAG: BTAD domain-containing putative transcriptional regulator [Anaerolineae bacterium]|nr:BTAD domain-containing putative transcriptional regulator [Anaerolineae bacterium]